MTFFDRAMPFAEGLLILIIGVCLFGGGFWYGRRTAPEDKISSRAAEPKQVIVAQPTRRLRKVEYVEVPVPIRAPKLSKRDVAALARKYGVALQQAPKTADEEVTEAFPVGENILPRLLYGGTELLTREPSGEIKGRIVPKKSPWLAWRPEWQVGGGVVRDFATGATFEPTGWTRFSPVQVKRFRPYAEVGFRDDAYLAVGVFATF